jgi:hypothetical protein
MKYSGKIQKKGGIVRPTKKNIKKFCFTGNQQKRKGRTQRKNKRLNKKDI